MADQRLIMNLAVKIAKFWLSESIFYVKLIAEYDFRGTLIVIDIFWISLFKPPYFLKWRPIFDDLYSTECKTQKLFKGLVVGLGPKGMPGRMCDIVH